MAGLSRQQAAELRARALRVAQGVASREDLSRLFLGLRTRTGDAQFVQDVADFVAHPDRRDTGATASQIARMFSVIRFKIYYSTMPIDPLALPENFATVFRSAFELLPQRLLHRDTGLNRSRARGTYRALLSSLKENPDGTRRLNFTNREEIALFKSLVSYISLSHGFDDNQLAHEFFRVLRRNDLLEAGSTNTRPFPMLSLFAAISMHGVQIDIPTGEPVELTISETEGRICVLAFGMARRSVDPLPARLDFGVDIFRTALRVEDWCSPEIVRNRLLLRQPLELTDEPKLRPL